MASRLKEPGAPPLHPAGGRAPRPATIDGGPGARPLAGSRGRAPGERGFALLVVLWTLILVSLLILQLSETGGAQARLASNLRRSASAEQAADAAVAAGAFHLMDRAGAWPLAGGTRRLTLPNATADLTWTNEAGKVDLNNASQQIIAALIQTAGDSAEDAAALSDAILAWHTPVPPDQKAQSIGPYRAAGLTYAPMGAPFESVDELALVLGVTPALYERLRPHVTVFQGGDPVLTLADPFVRRAATLAGEVETGAAQGDPGANDVVDLRATAHAAGATFTRTAIIQLEPGEGGAAYRVLAWSQGR